MSCKLYKSSTRKEKIRAALESPVNAELVKQFDEYLDEEYRPKKQIPTESTEVEDNDKNSDSSDEWGFDNHNTGSHAAPHHSSPNLSERHSGEFNGNKSVDTPGEPDGVEDDEEIDDVPIVDSSTKTKKTSISADTIVTSPFIENHITLSGLAGELKGTLNARSNTNGVVRVSVKNDEVWIYYSDDINLNNVMSSVIDLLNAANYQYLIFNRLARTDNAIVFTINNNDTSNEMVSIINEG